MVKRVSMNIKNEFFIIVKMKQKYIGWKLTDAALARQP